MHFNQLSTIEKLKTLKKSFANYKEAATELNNILVSCDNDSTSDEFSERVAIVEDTLLTTLGRETLKAAK